MTAAIFYHPDAYSISGPKLMGRNAAGESFLRGFFAYGRADAFYAQVVSLDHGQDFADQARAVGRAEPIKVIETGSLGALAGVGTLFFPGPDIGDQAWRRAAFGHGAWSLCGITHTTASKVVTDGITDFLTAPVQPWDALICTSTAVKDNVQALLQAQADYLRSRLGATQIVIPLAPVIPLGIHCRDFAFDADQRAAARKSLGAGQKTHVVLYMGRLSPHAKAHPFAMYQALEIAAQRLPADESITLVECGWFANDGLKTAYAKSAALLCPSVRVVSLDGRDAQARRTAWAGADMLCSFADNIQETFGIVPIEGMAAGLPVVVSDWDGYRDSVRDGVDGFRIATTQPPPGLGGDLALRHALDVDTYDLYVGHACSFTAVDVEAAAAAFSRLFASPDLRRSMGEAGRTRAQTVFDWSAIIPHYEALWARMAQIRQAGAAQLPTLSHPWPARMDPFHAFAGYPSRILTPETRLTLTASPSDIQARLKTLKTLSLATFNAAVAPTETEIDQILFAAAPGPTPALSLIATCPPDRHGIAFRGLGWLLKMGLLRVDG